MQSFMRGRDITAVYELRRFARFFTSFVGVTGHRLPNTSFSLQDGRILYEIGHHQNCTATDICRTLKMDSGYLSRRITHFARHGLITRTCLPEDNRVYILKLTEKGERSLAALEDACTESAIAWMDGLSAKDKALLVDCMDTIEHLLSKVDNALE